MKEGFWGNYETGEWFRIDEHERWLRTPGNAERLGVSEDVAAVFAKYQTRDELLPFVYRHAPVMRWRGHGSSVTFEFDSAEWGRPLELIHNWGRSFAGDHLHFHMVNFRTMEVRDALWRDLRLESESRRADELYMVRPQHELTARFRHSEGVCLIADPVWKGVPKVKLFNFPTVDEVVLRFTGHAVHYARENYDPALIEEQPDGSLLVTIYDAIDFMVVNLVLNEGGAVRVVSPPELAEKVVRQAERVIAANRPDR